MKKYYSRKDTKMKVLFGVAILVGWLPLVSVLLTENSLLVRLIFGFVVVLYTAFLLDIWINTYYWVDNGKLFWKAGHLIGSHIEISKVKWVKKHKNSFLFTNGTHKPTLVFNPTVIRYNTYDEVPVSPIDEQAFLDQLLKENPNIEIKDE